MGEPMKKTSCQIACWAMGAGAGVVAFVMLMALGGWSFIQAVFGAAVVFAVLGALLSWILCKPLPALGEVKAGMDEIDDAASSASTKAPAAPATTASASPVKPSETPKAAAASAPAAEIKSGTLLAGEKELAARKGEWTYKAAEEAQPMAKAKAKPKAEAKRKAAPKPKAEAKSKAKAKSAEAVQSAVASDGQGEKPATLSEARGGKADDLKQIKGVGPKLEAMLHGMGFYHFDQVASWNAAELAWVDDNLTGFKGRASRDNWVDQARTLASGGETEFSKRVEGGDVY
jgi:predicted flap endonuclease-1-like 5' DNA nuclease